MRNRANRLLMDVSGMGLLEVMIAGAIMTITILTMFGSMNYVARSQKGISQLTALDSIAGGITRMLSDPVRCRDAFKEVAGTAPRLIVPPIPWSVLPSPPQHVDISEISIGSGASATILAKPGPAQGGLDITLLRFENPVAGQAQDPTCPEGVCNVYPATLVLEAKTQTTDGTVGAQSKRFKWVVTIVANSVAPFRVSSCSGTGGGTGTVTGTGVAGYIPMWSGTPGALIDTVLFQTPSGVAGKLGIGTITPAAMLSIAAQGYSDPVNYGQGLQITTSPTGGQLATFIRQGNNAVSLGFLPGGTTVFGWGAGNPVDASFTPNYMNINVASGDVAIGTMAAGAKLHVAGSFLATGTVHVGTLGVPQASPVCMNSAAGGSPLGLCISSKKYKHDLGALAPADYERILGEVVRTDVYTYRHNTDRPEFLRTGLIGEYLPKAISVPDPEGNLTPDWFSVYGYLWASVRGLYQRMGSEFTRQDQSIARLAAENAKLSAELARQRERIRALEARLK